MSDWPIWRFWQNQTDRLPILALRFALDHLPRKVAFILGDLVEPEHRIDHPSGNLGAIHFVADSQSLESLEDFGGNPELQNHR